jgi:16S rRNA (cytosine1402-N4)-methyltransferase
VLVDCTVGLGGHAELLLEAAGEQAALIGIDLDEDNLLQARQNLAAFGSRVRLFQANFSEIMAVLDQAGLDAADAILADLGVASIHLDDPQRGFSFMGEGPLDMRMDRRSGATAADLVNRLSERELADLIYRYGEERYSRRIARAIVEARAHRPIATTAELAELAVGAYPAVARRMRRGVHPATRTFQALRIATNDEMSHLERFLEVLPRALRPGGRAAVISFHSLEDRRVKQTFAGLAQEGRAKLLTRKPIVPTMEETAHNPRSRSAKLRGIERIG